jgi:ubiquinol-cytochrome c reductase cytochrome c subunit
VTPTAEPARRRPRLFAASAVACAFALPPLLAPAPTPAPSASAGVSTGVSAGVSAAAGAGASPTPSGVPGAPPSVAPSNPMTGRGGSLYGQNCASCHGNQAEGTQNGPPLVGVGSASVDFQLSTGRMPLRGNAYQPSHQTPAFSRADIDAIVGYVSGFGGGGPGIPDVNPGDVADGRTLYVTHCAACHSAAGVGATLTNGQVAPSLMRSTPTQVGEAVRVGPGLMPAFPDTVLTSRDVDALAGYVQTLQNKRGDVDRGGLSLGRVGPFTEGLLAWVVGLGLLVLAIRLLGSRAS